MRPQLFDPGRLFRGAGIGAAIVTPLGPLGLDLGYGFDKVNTLGQPRPGWRSVQARQCLLVTPLAILSTCPLPIDA